MNHPILVSWPYSHLGSPRFYPRFIAVITSIAVFRSRRIQIYGHIQDRLSQEQISTILRLHGSNYHIRLSDTQLGLSTFSSGSDVCRTLRRSLSEPVGPSVEFCRTPGEACQQLKQKHHLLG